MGLLTRIPSSTFSPPYTFIPSSRTPISPRKFRSATRIPMTDGLLKQRKKQKTSASKANIPTGALHTSDTKSSILLTFQVGRNQRVYNTRV